MIIQCTIERDGVTSVGFNGFTYHFEPNKHGHYVCTVSNYDAERYFLETFSGRFYNKYVEPVEPPKEDLVESGKEKAKDLMKQWYSEMETKDDVEAECFADFGVDLSKKYSLKNMKEQVYTLIDNKYKE